MSDAERARIEAAYERRADVAGRYDPRLPEVVATRAALARAFGSALLKGPGGTSSAVLEVGCGFAGPLAEPMFDAMRPRIGIDVQIDRVTTARRLHPTLDLVVGDGRGLPARDRSFDVIVCSTLFSSILDDGVAAEVAAEIDRVLRPGGVVLWFDLRMPSPGNPDVRPLANKDLRRLFPGYRVDVRPCALIPPLARRLAGHPVIAALAEQIRPLRSHLGGGLWKSREAG